MEILEKLKDQGWHLTEDGLKKLPDNNDLKKIISAALDFDFREIAGGALPPDLTKKDESFPGNIVLQVQRIRNISAPKANEESKAAPRFLQIELSDGVTLMQALELEHISVLSMNTLPGTKIHFKSKQIALMQGMIVMKPVEIQVLGGRVAALVEKWEMTRSLQKYAKYGRQQGGGSGSGPPPWIPFGQKMQQPVNSDKNFKSFTPAEKEKDTGKENVEFNAMRSEAIAEAAKIGGKKVFGGGNHHILDHNVKKILEKGYTEEEAKHALRSTGNSLERALYNLKRRGEAYKNREDFRDKYKAPPMGGNKRGGKDIGNKRGKEAEAVAPAKPAANVSLFDFLTDKLPTNAEPTSSLSQPSTTTATTATPSFASQNNSSQSSYSRPMTKAGSEPSTKPYYNSSSNSNQSHGNYHDRKQQQQQQNHESNSAGKSQDQNSHTSNNNNSNRPKFENNLSSSFANRNSSHPNDERYNRYLNSNRGRGGNAGGGVANTGNPFHGRPNQPFEESADRQRDQKNSSGYNSGGGRGGGRGSHNNNYSGGRGGSSSGGYDNRRYNDYHNQKDQQNQHRHERQDQNQPQRNGYDQKAAANGKEAASRYQQQKENSSNYQQNNSGNTRNYDSNRQAAYNNNNNNSSHNTNSTSNNSNNNDHTARVNKLVESTSKMKIDKTRSGPSARNNQQQQQHQQQQHYQQQNYATQQQQQQPKQQQQQQLPPPINTSATQKLQQTFGMLPNGFNYDPSKIIGFQAKETNEFALTLLKSQGVPTGPPPHTAANQPPPPAAAQPQFLAGPPPTSMHMAPQPFTTATYVVPQGVAAPTHSPSAFGMIPGENWNWKIGDRCLAKYWDDGRYYEAEITGISDKTCVVLFLGYGNHEEVLKTDCLPITDAQNRTINFSNNLQHTPPVSVAPQQQQPQQQQQQTSMLSRGVPNRNRFARQVYVPPSMRKKKQL